ncbi:MAG: hypothetical protein E6R09_00515 [Rhodocyclaceae bacterium]|nr:MAG: hypothetical protein E6R09_00515 [Rhodocyclaceae bacterium]
MRKLLPRMLAATLLLASPLSRAALGPAGFPFDPAQLAGVWTENASNEIACAPDKLQFRFRLDTTRQRLDILLDRLQKLGDREAADRYSAQILSATANTLIIRYDNEQRVTMAGKPVEWELSVVAPGIYRWRATDWQRHEVNSVVGIRCQAD